MESNEPSLVPEWYRTGMGLKSSSDDNGVRNSSRNRLPLIPCDMDDKMSLSRNGSMISEERDYSNFAMRDEKKKSIYTRDRDREIGSRYYRDSAVARSSSYALSAAQAMSRSSSRARTSHQGLKFMEIPKPIATKGAGGIDGQSKKDQQIRKFQVLSREKTGIISFSAAEDVSLKSSINNPNLKAQSTNTSSLNGSLSLSSFGDRKPFSPAQNKNDFFNSLRNKTSSCDSIEQNAGEDASLINEGSSVVIKEENNTGSEDKQLERKVASQSLADDGETQEYPVDDLDERDKVFMRSLGWNEDESATVAALTAEEISAFIEHYQKLRPYYNFGRRFEAIRLSLPAQTS